MNWLCVAGWSGMLALCISQGCNSSTLSAACRAPRRHCPANLPAACSAPEQTKAARMQQPTLRSARCISSRLYLATAASAAGAAQRKNSARVGQWAWVSVPNAASWGRRARR